MYCQYCGNEITKVTKFCPSCGANLSENRNNTNNKTDYTSNSNSYDSNSSSFTGNDSLAVVAYFTWIGFFIALILNRETPSEFVNFHLNQALIINIGFLISAIPVVGWIISIVLFIFWVMAVINAIQKKMTPLPLLGEIHIIY